MLLLPRVSESLPKFLIDAWAAMGGARLERVGRPEYFSDLALLTPVLLCVRLAAGFRGGLSDGQLCFRGPRLVSSVPVSVAGLRPALKRSPCGWAFWELLIGGVGKCGGMGSSVVFRNAGEVVIGECLVSTGLDEMIMASDTVILVLEAFGVACELAIVQGLVSNESSVTFSFEVFVLKDLGCLSFNA